MCPKNHWIASAAVRNVDYLGAGRTGGDDSGIEGLKFKCKSMDGSSEEVITHYGRKGEWKNWSQYVKGRFVKEARVRMWEQGTDYAGITGLSLWMCPAD